MVGRAEALAIQVARRADPVKDHTARGDAALRWHGHNLVDAASELAPRDQLAQEAAHRTVEVEGGPGEGLAGGDGDGQRVDGDIGGCRGDKSDPHEVTRLTNA